MRYMDMTPEEKKQYHRAKAIESRLRNPDQVRLASKKWRLANKERFAAMKRAWNLANPEKVKEMKRRERAKHADAIYERNKAYMAANRPKYRAYRMAHHYRNPEQAHTYVMKRRHLITGKLTRGLTKRLLEAQEWRCKACQCDLHVSGYHRDHIMPLALGGAHEDANIQILCPFCNLSKGAKSPTPMRGQGVGG
jgi:5-methylcytosine-specific restriction endonuclease McrA